MSSSNERHPQPSKNERRRPERIESSAGMRSAASESDLTELLDATSDAILIHRDLRYVYANSAALKLLGRKREDVLGHSPFDLVPPRFRLLLAQRVMEAYTTRTPRPEVEERLLHASGAEVPVEVIDIPLVFRGELATLVHIRDITARRELEIRLRAAERLEGAGLIAAAVAHEICNPLTYALANIERLEELFDEDRDSRTSIRELLGVVKEGIAHAAEVAREARVFATASHTKPSLVDLREVLIATVAFLGPELRSRVNLIERYDDVPNVLGNEPRLAQVFLNLLRVAVQSLSHGSRCANDVMITMKAKSEALVVVTIEATGITRTHDLPCAALEPLFSTKPSGSGVSLALCKELLSKQGGKLLVESIDTGTIFTVTLPTAPREPPCAELDAPVHSSGRHILIVNDEPTLAMTLKKILCEHRTTVAMSDHEALRRLHSGEVYDVIVCDVLTENVDGIELYRHIREEWPGVHSRIVFLTGEAFISRTQEFLATIPNRHLPRPVEPDDLLESIDEVLAIPE